VIDKEAIEHIENYFYLSQNHFIEGDHALAAFFAITAIEETAKLLIVGGTNLEPRRKASLIKETLNHRKKYFSALINLIDQSSYYNYKVLPEKVREEVDSWWNLDRLMGIRNSCLYLSFDGKGKPVIPKNSVDFELATILVYVAGVAIATLDEYIAGLPVDWAKSIIDRAELFRSRFLAE